MLYAANDPRVKTVGRNPGVCPFGNLSEATGMVRVVVCERYSRDLLQPQPQRLQPRDDQGSAPPTTRVYQQRVLSGREDGHTRPERPQLMQPRCDLNRIAELQGCPGLIITRPILPSQGQPPHPIKPYCNRLHLDVAAVVPCCTILDTGHRAGHLSGTRTWLVAYHPRGWRRPLRTPPGSRTSTTSLPPCARKHRSIVLRRLIRLLTGLSLLPGLPALPGSPPTGKAAPPTSRRLA